MQPETAAASPMPKDAGHRGFAADAKDVKTGHGIDERVAAAMNDVSIASNIDADSEKRIKALKDGFSKLEDDEEFFFSKGVDEQFDLYVKNDTGSLTFVRELFTNQDLWSFELRDLLFMAFKETSELDVVMGFPPKKDTKYFKLHLEVRNQTLKELLGFAKKHLKDKIPQRKNSITEQNLKREIGERMFLVCNALQAFNVRKIYEEQEPRPWFSLCIIPREDVQPRKDGIEAPRVAKPNDFRSVVAPVLLMDDDEKSKGEPRLKEVYDKEARGPVTSLEQFRTLLTMPLRADGKRPTNSKRVPLDAASLHERAARGEYDILREFFKDSTDGENVSMYKNFVPVMLGYPTPYPTYITESDDPSFRRASDVSIYNFVARARLAFGYKPLQAQLVISDKEEEENGFHYAGSKNLFSYALNKIGHDMSNVIPDKVDPEVAKTLYFAIARFLDCLEDFTPSTNRWDRAWKNTMEASKDVKAERVKALSDAAASVKSALGAVMKKK